MARMGEPASSAHPHPPSRLLLVAFDRSLSSLDFPMFQVMEFHGWSLRSCPAQPLTGSLIGSCGYGSDQDTGFSHSACSTRRVWVESLRSRPRVTQLVETGAGKGQNVLSAVSETCPGDVLGVEDGLRGELYNAFL